MKNRLNKFLCTITAMLLAVGLPFAGRSAPVSAGGGAIIYDIQEGDISYRVHVFTNAGSATLTVSNGGFVDCLVVGGGGGGGGGAMAGGGGGGGVIFMQGVSITSGVYAVTVGAGGLGGYAYNLAKQTGVRGDNSTFGGELVALGGGGGCGWTGHPSTSGGSGGGGNSDQAASPGTTGQGYAGARGSSVSTRRSGGGGGGAGEPGHAGVEGAGGKGGDGREIFGHFYGGGGGGGLEGTPLVADAGGPGGLGGGGAGSRGSTNAINATPNTGGGGGGAGYNGPGSGRLGGNGGSGIVIIRYATGPMTPVPDVTLADAGTGSERFTNTNGVRITAFPAYAGYDKLQCTGESNSILAFDDAKWVSTNDLAGYYATFDRPIVDTNVTLYVWFTNTTDTAKSLLRSSGQIYFTSEAPVPVVRPNLTRERLPGTNVLIHAADLDIGSSGGVANGMNMTLYARQAVAVVSEADLTPDEPYVTFGTAGVYRVKLWLQNEAGNTILSAATCMVTVADSAFATNTWTGAGLTELWSEGVNWSAGLPASGQNVAITGATHVATIDATCASLSSFTMTAGTLTFTNWATCLRADAVELRGGQFTLPPPFVNNAMSNRVHVQCAGFTLNSGAKIDVTGKGFAGGIVTGNGPGGKSGASYGGTRLGFGFPATYGSAQAPTDPGSGGGSLQSPIIGGAGGGAVWIEATGTVTVDGSILSDGKEGSAIHSSGGSGGSIYITCNRFEGSGSGLLSACGARGSYSCQGGGSGGRIAVVYNTLAQAGHNPGVRFTAAGGLWAATGYGQYAYWPDRRCNEQGTLYCTDASFLSSILGAGQFKGVTFSAENFTHWAPASLTVSNDTAIAFHHDDGFELNVGGDIRVEHATLGLYGPGALTAGGDLTLSKGSQVRIYSASTNGLGVDHGACVEVAGQLTLNTGNWLYPISHHADGSSVLLRLGSLNVAFGGGINATAMGYGPGFGRQGYQFCGASHGGKGGIGGWGGQSIATYGSTNAPVEPGASSDGNAGGGLIQLEVAGSVRLNGQLLANGGGGASLHRGGGAGGSIFMQCKTLSGEPSGLISAAGSVGGGGNGAGGGGGRIAIWCGPPADAKRRAKIIAGLPSSALIYTDFTALTAFSGTNSVAGGTGYAVGGPGSSVVVINQYNPTTMILLR